MTVEFEAYELKRNGKTYHIIPAQSCSIQIVTRYDGRQEAALIRANGSWLPPLFSDTYHDPEPRMGDS